MNVEKIGKLEAICLILIIIINEIVLNIPNIIILGTGSSAIMNVIFISAIAVFIAFLVSKLFKNFEAKDILDISQYLGGNTLKFFVGIAFLVFFLLLCSIAVRYLTNSIKLIYFNNSPLVYLLLFFIVPAVVINKFGLKTISGINVVFIFIMIGSLLFLLLSSYKEFSFTRIFPIFGNGLNETFLIGATNIFAFTGFAYLLFLPPLLKESSDFKKVTIYSIVITAICLLFSITSLIFTLPITTKSDEMLSIYLLTRTIEFGTLLERLDALFIFAWLLSLLSSLSIHIFYIIQIFKKIGNLKHEKALSPAIGTIILGGSLLIKNYSQIKFLGNYIYRYGFIALVFGIGLGVLVLANVKYIRDK